MGVELWLSDSWIMETIIIIIVSCIGVDLKICMVFSFFSSLPNTHRMIDPSILLVLSHVSYLLAETLSLPKEKRSHRPYFFTQFFSHLSLLTHSQQWSAPPFSPVLLHLFLFPTPHSTHSQLPHLTDCSSLYSNTPTSSPNSHCPPFPHPYIPLFLIIIIIIIIITTTIFLI